MNDTDLKARVRQALERTDVMALSTIDDDGGPWTRPVRYQSDSQLNLYFASMPDARHIANIQRDARVAVAIYNMPGPRAATSASRSADTLSPCPPTLAATAGSSSKSNQPKPGASTPASTGNVTMSTYPASNKTPDRNAEGFRAQWQATANLHPSEVSRARATTDRSVRPSRCAI
jgi:Pyridoxamine 5'-phosphate oxidase